MDPVYETYPPEEVDVEDGPTPSRNTNRLIGICLSAAAGRLDAESLRQALTACGTELAEAKEAFYYQVKEEEGLLAALPDAIEAVMDAFDAYGEGLDQARTWLVQRDPAVLHAAADALAQAYLGLHHALLAYEWAYLGHGDEPHPALNLMRKVLAALRLNQMEDDLFDEILDRLWDHFTKGIETFEQDSDPARAIRGAQACRQALAGVQDMDGYFEAHDLEVVESGFVRFREGCLLLVEQIQDSVGEALVHKPTPSPQVNWVIHAARAVLEGLEGTILERARVWFEPQLSESYFRFEQCATSALEGPARMAEQVPVAREGFDRLNRSLPLLRLGVDRRELLPRGLDLMETGAGLLFQAWQTLVEVEQALSEANCPRCGAVNPATDRVCSACGATLVRSVDDEIALPEEAVTVGSAHLQRILEACQKAEAGRMDSDEFTAVLTWAEQVLEKADLGLTRLPQEGEMGLETRQAVQDLRQGMADFREALGELQEFAEDGRPVHLTTGSRLLVQACDRLAEVQGRALVG